MNKFDMLAMIISFGGYRLTEREIRMLRRKKTKDIDAIYKMFVRDVRHWKYYAYLITGLIY